MALKGLPRVFRAQAPVIVVGAAEGCAQTIRLETMMLSHVYRHRQRSFWTTEAGGQLFGLVDETAVRVICATGPYSGDERSRYRYRSNPRAAQQAVEIQARSGMLYLGEWHTHAEDSPNASSLDNDAMKRLMANSKLNSNALLMLIVGRSAGPNGLALLSVESSKVQQWELMQSK